MPFTRRTRHRPRYGRGRKFIKRRRPHTARKFNITKSLNYKGVVYWKEKVAQVFAIGAATGQTAWTTTLAAKLSDIPNAPQFRSLFDMYKIIGLSYKFFPVCAAIPADITHGTTSYWTPQLALKIDYDGGADWGTTGDVWNQALEANSKVRSFTGDRPQSIYLKPKMLQKGYENSSSPADVIVIDPTRRQPWVDMRFPDTEYHGLKVAVNNPPGSLTDNSDMQCVITYYFAFRGHM